MKYFTYILFTILSGLSIAQEVINTSLSSCDSKSNPAYIRDRLIEKELKNDTLFLNVGLVLNCCPSLNTELTYRNDTLFLKITDESDITCMCECCFELQIKAIGVPDTNFTLIHQFETLDLSTEDFTYKIEGRELRYFKSKYIFPSLEEMNDFTEVNLTDSKGRKVGIWDILYEETEKVKYRRKYFINDQGESKVSWIVRFDEEGSIEEVCGSTKENTSACVEKYGYDKLFNNNSQEK